MFGFSFVPLMQEDGRTLPDGTHELIVHKVLSVSYGRQAKKSRAVYQLIPLVSLKETGKRKRTEMNILL